MLSGMTKLDDDALACVPGGAGQPQNQQQLRDLARQYCPQTYRQFRNAPITRPIAERCLDEAGYGQYTGMLDRYFPRR